MPSRAIFLRALLLRALNHPAIDKMHQGSSSSITEMLQQANSETRVVTLKDATIANISPIYHEVSSALSESEQVEIDLHALEAVDLSFLQLADAARAEATARGKSIRLTHPATTQLADLLDRSGRLTRASAADHEFWFHGELPQ